MKFFCWLKVNSIALKLYEKEKLKELENIITDQEDKIKEQENKIKEQKNKFTEELLSYVSSISMPLKRIKYFVKKSTSHIANIKKQQSKIKLIKLGKQPGTTSCLGCKVFTQTFRQQKVKMTNKVLRKNQPVLFVSQIRQDC